MRTGPSGGAIGPTGPTDPGQRATALRLARLHLRLGSLGLARAELEALAGSGELDEAALLDLAEVRWRTGDLPGAGEAAAAAIATGDQSALALVIAAEAAFASSRPAEARRVAGQALERADVPIDRIFAGMPRSAIWPHDADGRAAGDGREVAGVVADTRGRGHEVRGPVADAGPAVPGVAAGTGHGARVRPTVASHGHAVEQAAAAGSERGAVAGVDGDADTLLATGRAAVAAGDALTAAAAFGLVLRAAPSRAGDVLAALVARVDVAAEPTLALVRADALALLGRPDEAAAVYTAASSAVAARAGAARR